MAANTLPIFGRQPSIAWDNAMTAANTSRDASTGTVYLAFVADSNNGSFVESLRFQSRGTNVATVARIFINNGNPLATPTNQALFAEVTLPSTTASEVAALASVDVPMNVALPANYTIRVTLGTAVAAGYDVTATAADY